MCKTSSGTGSWTEEIYYCDGIELVNPEEQIIIGNGKKNNCQDWASNVRKEYKHLLKELPKEKQKEIKKECKKREKENQNEE